MKMKDRKDMEKFLKQVYSGVDSKLISDKDLSDDIDKHWSVEWKYWNMTRKVKK